MDFGALPPEINSGRTFRARLRVDAGCPAAWDSPYLRPVMPLHSPG